MLRRTWIVLLILTVLGTSSLSAYQEELPCVGEAECYEHPDDDSDDSSESSWEGYSDTRLNPQMDEYYSVYCNRDVVEVWGFSAANPQEVSRIPIRRLIDGPFSFDDGNGLTVNRVEDTITISGSNGYGPNHPGSKSFSLAECIARNGGEPPAEEPVPPPQSDGSIPEINVDTGITSTCADYNYYVAHLDECSTCSVIYYRATFPEECPSDEPTSYELLFGFLISACVNHPVGIGAVFAFTAIRRRRKH